MDIKKYLGDSYMEKFRVFHPILLFEPTWEALQVDRCPICSNKLKFARSRPIAYCNGKKHRSNFSIGTDRLAEIKKKYHVDNTCKNS